MRQKLKILYNWIRGYNFGDPTRNGEYRFLRSYVRDNMIIFDVGANVGDYAGYVLSLANNVQCYCFEPAPGAYAVLEKKFHHHAKAKQVYLNRFGLSDRPGAAAMKIYDELAGCNSLYERCFSFPSLKPYREQDISLITLDEYLSDNGISHVNLLKIDVEGHESKVLQGGTKALQTGSIDCIQFEYGGSFLDAGTKLEAIYELLIENRYQLFRLLPYGKILVKSFHPSLENYQHSNWLALNKSLFKLT